MASLGTILGLLAGNFDFVQLSWGVLTVSDVFPDLLESFAMPCTRVRVSDASVWLSSLSGSPMRDSEPLEGKSDVADMFADIFELFATPCVCMGLEPTRSV